MNGMMTPSDVGVLVPPWESAVVPDCDPHARQSGTSQHLDRSNQ